jgi:hypothetical protein
MEAVRLYETSLSFYRTIPRCNPKIGLSKYLVSSGLNFKKEKILFSETSIFRLHGIRTHRTVIPREFVTRVGTSNSVREYKELANCLSALLLDP